MKHKLLLAAGAALAAAAISVFVYVNNVNDSMDEFFNANVEALADTEGGKENGALWSNPEGTRYCCGPGNVRDCNEANVPKC